MPYAYAKKVTPKIIRLDTLLKNKLATLIAIAMIATVIGVAVTAQQNREKNKALRKEIETLDEQIDRLLKTKHDPYDDDIIRSGSQYMYDPDITDGNKKQVKNIEYEDVADTSVLTHKFTVDNYALREKVITVNGPEGEITYKYLTTGMMTDIQNVKIHINYDLVYDLISPSAGPVFFKIRIVNNDDETYSDLTEIPIHPHLGLLKREVIDVGEIKTNHRIVFLMLTNNIIITIKSLLIFVEHNTRYDYNP